MAAVTHTNLKDYLPLVATGKVREIYELDDSTLLFVATDRVSAYDVVMENAVNQKGAILTQLSEFWFRMLQGKMPALQTHLLHTGLPNSLKQRLPPDLSFQLERRCMVVKKLEVLPIESIVRGYITGSAWSAYQKGGSVCGIALPSDLKESQKFEQPLWTPSTKAEAGGKDENISPQEAADIVGKSMARDIEKISLQVYEEASIFAAEQGIIIADTKLEFGIDRSTDPPSLVLIDELLTPDSSRFWSVEGYKIGKSQESFDKQYLRDWLVQTSQKGQEGVTMPGQVVANTLKRYEQAYQILVGKPWISE